MFIKYLCPACNRYFELGDDIQASEARCPDCGGEAQRSKARFVYTPTQIAESRIVSQRIAVGYLLALIIPLVGFVVGVYLLAKNQFGHGIGCMIVSLISNAFWYFILFAVLF